MNSERRSPIALLRAAPGIHAAILSLMAACALPGCRSQASDVAGRGGGAETTDGQIVASAGLAQGVRVRLVPADFSSLADDAWPDSLAAVTDAAGKYAFKSVAGGRYNLEALQPRDGTRLFLSGLVIDGDASRSLPAAALDRPGRLRLHWEGPHRGFLFMRGSTFRHRISVDEIEAPILELDSLPMGTLPPLYWSTTQADTAGARITDSLAILPDSPEVRYNFALTLKKAGYWHDAADELEKLLQKSPSETRGHLTLANLYAQQLAQPKLAREHYLKVLETNPRHPKSADIRYWLAANP